MAEKLTPQQKMAVTNRGGKLLVSAAAGSGKTKVLVDRLLSYITDPVDPANIDDFLIITYTKAAASELRGKIATKLSERIADDPSNKHLQRQMQRLYLAKISTVHAFCTDILREYAYRLDISSDFRVAEETECMQLQIRVIEQLLEEAYSRIDNDENLQIFIDTQGFGRNDKMIPEIILKVYNSARCHLNPDAWLQKCIDDTEAIGSLDAGQTVWGSYLIGRLKNSVKLHIHALEECITHASKVDGFDKVTALLNNTVYQLNSLVQLEKWDDFVDFSSIDFGTLSFPRKNPDPVLADRIKAVRNSCKAQIGKLMSGFADRSAKVLEDLSVTGAAASGLISLVRQFSERYDKLKRRKRVLDFGDLEHLTLQLFYGKSRSVLTSVAQEVGSRFREIMVDEYQDSNAVQDSIFTALTDKRNNCFMVGDVKQSIYQFRLADPAIFLKKYESYAPAELAQTGEPRKVLLSSNFRSAGAVISAVNDVFTCCMSAQVGGLDYGEEEMLREGIAHAQQTETEVEFYAVDVQQDTYEEEAAFVASRIRELLDGSHTIRDGDGFRPVKPEDIVILLRSPGSVGAEYCYALECAGVRCTMGGSVDLMSTEEIRFLHSLLQTVHNPMLDIPLVSVLTSRVFGFTANELSTIRSNATGISFFNALKKDGSEKVTDFLDTLEQLRQYARMNSVCGLIQKIYALTRMDSIYAAMDNGAEKIANLQSFMQFASSYEATGNRELGQFLDHLEIVSEKKLVSSADQSASGCVTVMSIHKSKGLEFPVVFLCALSRRFNHDSATAQVLCHKDLGLGLSFVDNHNRVRYPSLAKKAIATKITDDDISEEMRVLYVAMTRARDRLIMCYSLQNIQKKIAEVANRIDYTGKALLAGNVSCPGEWILQAALGRTEAGVLLSNTVKPDCSAVSEVPWKIDLVRSSIHTQAVIEDDKEDVTELPPNIMDKMITSLNYEYPYRSATVAPSKQTATQLKGRQIDLEAAENTSGKLVLPLQFRRPSFVEKKVDRSAFGNTVHLIMQYISYDRCTSLEDIQSEIDRLIQNGYVSAEICSQIDPDMIYSFFKTELGQRLLRSDEVLREFKFSVLVDGREYYSDNPEDRVLLQGVVDCALIEHDGISVIDFKTDRVSADTLQDSVDLYRLQVKAYCDALTRIYNMPIKAAYLYYFRIKTLIKV